MARRPRIALVDDEVDLTSALGEWLTDSGYDALTAGSVEEGRRLIEAEPVDLVVLDLNMPGGGGLELLRALRDRTLPAIPVLILTANPEPIERIVGLELGADDFLVKPVEPRELVARIVGLLRRFGTESREIVRFERTTADLTAARLLRDAGTAERLGPGEVVLIRAFARSPNRILRRDDLLDQAPADALDANDRAIDTRVARLRRKLDTEAIVTVRGHGYMFVPPVPDMVRPGSGT